MKIIKSAGGPLIGFDRAHAQNWGGVADKRFIGAAAPWPSDYEAVCALLDAFNRNPCDIAKFPGSIVDGLLITMPLWTAVIASDENSVYIAQVHYAEEDWSFSMINKDDFNNIEYDKNEEIRFYSPACTFMFFDAAYSWRQICDDYIKFNLADGNYIFDSGHYCPNEQTLLILYRIRKVSNF